MLLRSCGRGGVLGCWRGEIRLCVWSWGMAVVCGFGTANETIVLRTQKYLLQRVVCLEIEEEGRCSMAFTVLG